MDILARHYESNEAVRVRIDGDRIASVAPVAHGDPASLPVVAPGFFDLQVNGHGGTWFGQSGITADDVLATLEPHFRFGITRMCPTLVTNSFENLAGGFAAIREARERESWAADLVPGCHLEGPYISSEDGPRGAHPLEHVRLADWDEFQRLQEAAGGLIRLVTLAPEQENAIPFIERAVDAGVVVSLGHTAADAYTIHAAVDAGARLSTHLGNGAHGMIRRHPNYIWEQLAEPRLHASIITDGAHLPASVVKCILAVKGVERTIVTCDASGLAGCPPGEYAEGSIAVEVLDDGRIVIAGQRQLLAGSAMETDGCVAGAVRLGGCTLADAVHMASRNPARLLGFEESRLHQGSRADLVLLHHDPSAGTLEVRATVAAGMLRFGDLS